MKHIKPTASKAIVYGTRYGDRFGWIVRTGLSLSSGASTSGGSVYPLVIRDYLGVVFCEKL